MSVVLESVGILYGFKFIICYFIQLEQFLQ